VRSSDSDGCQTRWRGSSILASCSGTQIKRIPALGLIMKTTCLAHETTSVDPIGIEDRILMFTKDACTQEGKS
jgi:hypothetical protein